MFKKGVESSGVVPGGGPNERFPGYDVLAEIETWDAVTAGVVLDRLGPAPDLRFFTVEEEAIGRCLFDQLLDQRSDPKVPVLELVDARLAERETDGWRYEDMPEDDEAFRRSFAALEQDAQVAYGKRFCDLDWADQADVVQHVQDQSGNDWHGMSAKHVWSLWTRYGCAAFYSHPWAWNEIGFGGPAYPRGYKHMGFDAREPWEVPDRIDRSPTGWGERVERARRKHAAVRSRQMQRHHPQPDAPHGFPDEEDAPREGHERALGGATQGAEQGSEDR